MRAWVTGCDNLLDDEYKSVLPFDLSGEGYRFRSVLMIMTADRVLCDILAEEAAVGGLSEQDARGLRHDTLRALVPSGLQEHDEETSICAILPPAELLEQVHVPKTGLLFEAPVRIARRLLPASEERLDSAQEGLRAFGLACQVLDDIVDFEGDVRAKRSNYVLSLAAAGGNGAGKTHAYADVDAATLDMNGSASRGMQEDGGALPGIAHGTCGRGPRYLRRGMELDACSGAGVAQGARGGARDAEGGAMRLFWLRFATRSLARRRARSGITFGAIALGVGILTFLGAMMVAVGDAMVENTVSLHTGHVLVRAEDARALVARWKSIDALPDEVSGSAAQVVGAGDAGERRGRGAGATDGRDAGARGGDDGRAAHYYGGRVSALGRRSALDRDRGRHGRSAGSRSGRRADRAVRGRYGAAGGGGGGVQDGDRAL